MTLTKFGTCRDIESCLVYHLRDMNMRDLTIHLSHFWQILVVLMTDFSISLQF